MLWTDKYRPQELSQVVGNKKEIKIITDWVDQWKQGNPQIPLLLVESSSSRSLFGDEYKLIILDEVDGIHGTNDRGGVRAIGEIIKNSQHPMILIANDFYSKRLQSIKPKCTVIKMKKSRWNSISALLRKIAQAEGVEVEPAALKEIAVKSQGDVRSAINTLQALAMWIEEDPTLVMEYIAENIPREYKKKDEIQKAYDYISKADIFFGRTNRSRNYGYWKYASDFMGIGVSISKHETYKKFTKIQTPTIFTTMGRNRGKRNLRDGIAEKMSEKMHISHSIAISMFPYLEIMFKNDELAWEISYFLDLDETEIKRFRKKKIPKKVVDKMEKQRAQMRVEERDRRAEELKNQMMNVIPEVDEPSTGDELPFEIPGIGEVKEETVEEEPVEEEVIEEEKTEKKEKKKTDKQVSLFSF